MRTVATVSRWVAWLLGPTAREMKDIIVSPREALNELGRILER